VRDAGDEPAGDFALVVFVQRADAAFDAVVIEQLARDARVLRQQQVAAGQDGQCAQRDIGEIPDRRGDEV